MLIRYAIIFVAFCVLFASRVSSKVKFGVGDVPQDWGHITIRPGAHMFWWLYYTTANVSHFSERPLIIWLAGGPGTASSCDGNIRGIGPRDINLQERNHTWVKNFNVLFIDNPIDVGFSYRSTDNVKLPINNKEIGADLIKFAKKFLDHFNIFQGVPLYIFGHSYGAKYAVEFASKLVLETKSNNIKVNFKGIGLLAGYISPIDIAYGYENWALTLGILNNHQLENRRIKMNEVVSLKNNGALGQARSLEMDLMYSYTAGLDVYNIVEKVSGIPGHTFEKREKFVHQCKILMRYLQSKMKIKEDINWKFNFINMTNLMRDDMLNSVTDRIEELLSRSNVKVVVIAGILDFIINVPGTVKWMEELQWTGADEFKHAAPYTMDIDCVNEAFVRKTEKLSLYIVQRAGHNIMDNNPVAIAEILNRELLDEFNEDTSIDC